MVPEFVDRTGGSQWNRALPGGSARPSIRRESCGFGDLGRFNLWRPMVVERMRGSRWNRALPGGSQWNRALPGGSQWNRALLGGSRWVQAQPARTLRED